jgi:hypothetical protein
MRTRIRLKIGDIFQILSREGICYGQLLYRNKEWGKIVGVFRDFYDKEPKDFQAVVDRKPDFISIFPIGRAVRQGMFSIVGNTPVAECNKQSTLFRSSNNPGLGDETDWWFWDGENSYRIGRPLTEEEKKYPKRGMISAPLLIERVEDDYRVERDYL